MSHYQQQQFVSNLSQRYSYYFSNSRVLEVGSLDINGSIRHFFRDCNYTGIDVGPGPGVDLVCPGEKFFEESNSYDVVASTECFEHTMEWPNIFLNMVRLVRSGGLVFFTCAGLGRGEHGTARTDAASSPHTAANNYYQNLTDLDFIARFPLSTMFESYAFEHNFQHHDLYFFGIKK